MDTLAFYRSVDKLWILLRFTVSLQDVVSLPMLLVARHAYSPSSSGNTSLIMRVATPNFQAYASTLPFLLQVTCGSGSPSILTVSSKCSPSLIVSSFVVLLDRDGLPVVSSFEPSLPPLSLGGFHESVTDWLVISSYCKGPSGGPEYLIDCHFLNKFYENSQLTETRFGSDEIARFRWFGLTSSVDSNYTEFILLAFCQIWNSCAVLTSRHVYCIHPVRAALLLLLDNITRDW
ncbi:hypothetical protein ALC62_02217 [Cyphomyrmex costatus]|uniref:Uncharacterized protein n=1 Tax=Cyphomyrmex costatus TaxID=456900 RepID=A0A195D390_9HYME|nr:hypothetical protein ALC62_02217 [Cyphomyrmex costatus]